jgi:hypothetical protein
MRELRRRLAAEQALPAFDRCLPRPAKEPPVGPGWIHEISGQSQGKDPATNFQNSGETATAP